jgi:2-polyprenyl-3-methyl-5-hydroxy-6-metoxy-1,4-benzoquinol methylase
MQKWKTYFYLCAMQSRWLSAFLIKVGRSGRDALRTPDPETGDSTRWAFLAELSELARYAMIVGYVRRLRPGGSVLDVGSSIGVLANELKGDVSRYHGIERDPASVETARQRAISVADFSVADANTFSTSDKYDVIVFNETIYYLNDPVNVLRRYVEFLKPGGIIIVSNYVARHLLRMPGVFAQNFRIVDQTTVINALGGGWVIQVIQPPSAGH